MSDPAAPSSPGGGLATGKGGRPPINLRAKIAERTVEKDGQSVVVAVTRLDRIREVMQIGGFDKDAAARCGVHVATYRDWLKVGTNARSDLANGRRRKRQLSAHEKQCVELVEVVELAEAEARMLLMGVAEQLSRGGLEATTIVEKRDNGGQLTERSTKVETLHPDGAMIRWRLERRWPEDFSRRLEITGPGGAPVKAEVSVVDKLLSDLDRIANARRQGQAAIDAHSNGHGAEAANGAT